MRRFHFILLSLIILMPAIPASAQFRYGFRFGANMADARLSHAPGYSIENKSGFSGGIIFEYQMPTSGLAFDAGLMYKFYNVKIQEDGTQAMSMGRNHLEVPVHVKYKFWISKFHDLFGPLVYTGPSLVFRVDDNQMHGINAKGVQPGWDVGIGFDVINFLQITGGYHFALGNALGSVEGAPDAKLRTNGWNVSLALLFDF